MFEVGKKVIALVNYPDGSVKKGKIYPVEGIRKAFCKCSFIMLDIGLSSPNRKTRCDECGTHGIDDHGIAWKCSDFFAPYDDSLSSITVEELLEEVEGTAECLLK